MPPNDVVTRAIDAVCAGDHLTADHASAVGCALYLCGHTHGGQICLPGGRPVFTQLVRCRHGASGVWRQADMVGHTSTGLGVSPPILRFNCRGGAAVITLRRTGTTP